MRIIVPGKVYRRDDLDLTHTPMFQQVEGLVVGERITLADLKGTLTTFLQRAVREPARRCCSGRASFRTPSPASRCSSAACSARATAAPSASGPAGWRFSAAAWCIRAVFEAVGYDPERYTGFAFGVGIERVALLKYGVDDIRLFYENDLRFLEQFPL